MNMGEAVRSVLTQYATFAERARRSEYWWWFLAYSIAFVVLRIIDAAATKGILSLILLLALLVPNLAVGIRRLHDTSRSGWWILLGLIPIVGGIVLIVFACQDSAPANAYGPSPKGVLAS